MLNYQVRRILKHTWIDKTHRAVMVVIAWWLDLQLLVQTVRHHKRCEVDPAHGEAYSIQHYVIKFVRDLRQVGSFLRILCFPPPIKQTPRYNANIVDSDVKHIKVKPKPATYL